MKPGGGGDKIPGELEKKIIADLGSVANMKEEFIQAGVTQFGSGWCWLAVEDGKIIVMKTLNGENPLVHGGSQNNSFNFYSAVPRFNAIEGQRFSDPLAAERAARMLAKHGSLPRRRETEYSANK